MYLEIRQPVSSWGRTPGQLFFMAVLYTLFCHSSRENLTKNYRNYYKAVTAKIDSFHNSVILLTKPCFRSYKSCNLSHFYHFLKFLLQCDPLPTNTSQRPFFMPFLHVYFVFPLPGELEFARRAGSQAVRWICVIVPSLTRSVSFYGSINWNLTASPN